MLRPVPDEKVKKLLRLNALMAGTMSFLASLSYFVPSFLFPKPLSVMAFSASLFYFAYWLLFDRICRTCYALAGVLLSQIGVACITFAVYSTGGIISPFIFLYFAMLVSEAIYGLDNPVTLAVSVAGYLLVVAGQLFGFLPNPAPWSAAVYGSPLAVYIIAVITVSYLALTRGMSGKIIANLRGNIEDEQAEKAGVLKKFSELNSTAQLGVLAHRIAHDLRGPVASISGYIEMAALKAEEQDDKDALEELQTVVTGMSESLNGITRFGRSSAVVTETIQLAAFMHNLLAIIYFFPQSHGVSFVRRYPDGLDAAVKASRQDLQQAYFNLLKNAVEAVQGNPDQKTVEIVIEAQAGEIEISISDNGPGIVPEILGTLFKRSITTKKDGTGIGLLITRDLLLRNNGEIVLKNLPEGGLRAVTRLPQASPHGAGSQPV